MYVSMYIGLGSSYTWYNFKQCYITQYFFNWMRILTNLPLDYIIFIYSLCLQNFEVIKD